MASLAEMKVELHDLEDKKVKVEKQVEDANRQYKIGMWGVLIGIFLIPLYGLGLLLVLAGGLAAVTNRGKKGKLGTEIEDMEANIRELRIKIAEEESK